MQENRQLPAQELICINVDKVYDWVMKENTFTFPLSSPIFFPGVHNIDDDQLRAAEITCRVRPAEMDPVVILRRENRQFTIDGQTVCLQQLTIRKNFVIRVILTLPNGTVHRSAEIPVSGSEQVIMCAPDETEVTVTYTDLDCFVSSGRAVTDSQVPGGRNVTFSGLVVTVSICQSIQSTFPVTVEFLADFCEPRAELAIGSCPLPAMPPQCPVIFPD